MKNIVFKGEIIFVWLLVPFLAGIISGFNITTDISQLVIISTIVLWLLSLCTYWCYNKFNLHLNRWVSGSLIFLLLYSLGLSVYVSRNDCLKEQYYARKSGDALIAYICSEPRETNGILRFETQVRDVFGADGITHSTGKLLIALKLDPTEKLSLSYGDELLLPYKIAEIDPPFNPFEFNYKKYLSNQGINYQSFINSRQLKVRAHDKGYRIIAFAYKLRQKLIREFVRYIPDKESAALASTLILGYKADLSQEIISAYSKTGTMHVLSVSGMHVLLVFSILDFFFRLFAKKHQIKIVKVILILAAVWFYALLTGFSSAACRAAVMCSIFIVGETFGKKRNPYNTLAASALLLLVINPWFLLDAGFQLSYMAVLGLIYLYPKIKTLLYIKNKILKNIWESAAVSASAQIATIPISLFYFHQFPLYFLISNLLIVLPVALIMYAGIAFIVLVQIPANAALSLVKILGVFLSVSIKWVNASLTFIEHLAYSSLQFFPYGEWFYLIVFTMILGLAVAIQFRYKKLLFVSVAMAALLASYSALNQMERLNKQKVIFYSLRKDRAVNFCNGRNSYLFSNLHTTEKTYSFSVKPSMDALADSLFWLNKVHSQTTVYHTQNLFAFNNWRLLVVDKQLCSRSFENSIHVNAVLLSGNPSIKLSTLKNFARFDVLLADATNKDYRLKAWESEARKLKIDFHILKRNPDFEVALN